MADLKPILLVEDSPNDIDLTLAALEENHLANEVVVVRDGAEALDYLYHRGDSSSAAGATPPSCSSTSSYRTPTDSPSSTLSSTSPSHQPSCSCPPGTPRTMATAWRAREQGASSRRPD